MIKVSVENPLFEAKILRRASDASDHIGHCFGTRLLINGFFMLMNLRNDSGYLQKTQVIS